MCFLQMLMIEIFQDGTRRVSGISTSNANDGSHKHLTSYYESLRSNVMSILGQVKVPSEDMHVPPPPPVPGSKADNFDSYLTKLQSICTETMTNEEIKPITASGGSMMGSHHHVKQP